MANAAQNQHYVPKFILRKFLSNEKKEQVRVFQKSTGKTFMPSIKGVMAERRFNEFDIDEDYYASFEEGVCSVEDVVLPAYRRLVEEMHLDHSIEERALLGIFVAFQMLRVRAYRDRLGSMVNDVRERFRKLGINPDEVEELKALSEEDVRRMHIQTIPENISEFSAIIAEKDFALLRASEGRSFYLGDNPVVLHNDEPKHAIFGNLGLSVKGIQIYVPLTRELMLAAWCPSILGQFRKNIAENSKKRSWIEAGKVLGAHRLSDQQMTQIQEEMGKFDAASDELVKFVSSANAGEPIHLTNTQMDHYNSLQVMYARDFVVCGNGDFDLARRVVERNGPESRMKMRVR